MNKSQKIIVSVYVIASPIIGILASYKLSKMDSSYDPVGDTIVGCIFTIPASLILFCNITFILCKLWATKK